MANDTIYGSNSIDVTDKDGYLLDVGEILTVTEDVSIETSTLSAYGIYSQGSNTIIIDGLVASTNHWGIGAYGGGTSIRIGETSQVDGKSG